MILNELGKDKNNIDVHENYKCINNNDYTGIIFKNQNRIERILNNITDKYILICKVDIINENKQIILISVYDPPEE